MQPPGFPGPVSTGLGSGDPIRQRESDHGMRHKFNPERWERLVSEERHALLAPGTFLDEIGVEPGSVVARGTGLRGGHRPRDDPSAP